MTVGRSETADLVLDDESVAPYHAVFSFDGRTITVLNLTRSVQTLVNGTPIDHSPVTLRDELRVGPYTLKIRLVHPPAPPAANAAPPRGPATQAALEPRTEIARIQLLPTRRHSRGPTNAVSLRKEMGHKLLFDPKPADGPALRAPPEHRSSSGPESALRQLEHMWFGSVLDDDVPRTAPLAPAAFADPDPDEDDEDADIRPGFRLVSLLTAPRTWAPTSGATAVEVVICDDEGLRDTALMLEPGEGLVLGRHGQPLVPAPFDGLRLLKVSSATQVELEIVDAAQGHYRQNGETTSLDTLKTPAHAVPGQVGRYRALIAAGTELLVSVGTIHYHARFVPRPPPIPAPPPARPHPIFLPALGGAVLCHLLVGVFFALVGPSTDFRAGPREAYASVAAAPPRDVEVQPEPPPPPPPTERAEAPRSRRRPRKRTTAGPAPRVKTAGVLGAIGRLSRRAPGAKSIVSAVSNVDAVRAPGGSSYRVGALVGKAPTSAVRLGGGGGGKPLTRGSAALLKGGVGRIGKRGKTNVRGRVKRVTSQRVVARGHISREAVARVINQHLGEVQYCYERTLIKNPGLKGKLVLEWRIDTSGRVGSVRQRVSTLRSPEVASCIIAKLKTWRFPRPSGGVVIVSYPFIFSSIGF